MKRLSDFGKEVRPDFGVHENCYDCAEFYDGCPAWRASTVFECRVFNRLPDVGIEGKLGQEFSVARRRARTRPEPDPARRPAVEAPSRIPPTDRPDRLRPRTCACGTALPKGKQVCDRCRTDRRRRTRREYMARYRTRQHPAAVGSGSDSPFPAQGTHATPACRDDRRLPGHPGRVARFEQTSVLQTPL